MATDGERWMIAVARRLGALRDEVVFVGGSVLGLLIDQPGSTSVRPTDDLDIIVEVSSRLRYDAFTERLRVVGFEPDPSEGAPLCRWKVDDVIVDVMPTSPDVLGFSNRWYPDCMLHAVRHEIADGLLIRVATAPYFVAMKLEAFAGRGRGDFVASHDLEDIIAVVDGHAALVEEVHASSDELRAYFTKALGALIENEDFMAALAGHLPGDPASQARLPLVRERLSQIAGRE